MIYVSTRCGIRVADMWIVPLLEMGDLLQRKEKGGTSHNLTWGGEIPGLTIGQ